MIRINLIPPEITQKRKTESRLALIILLFVIMVVIMGAFTAVMFVQVGIERDAVAALEQEVAAKQAQAEQFRIFEEQEGDLGARQQLADDVVAGRIDWGRLCEELSLVLPDDVWIEALTGDELEGVTLVGKALDNPVDVPDSGHKGIARTLVRLADLEQLYNVWLTNSTRSAEDETYEERWFDFQITASVIEPEPETTAGDEPAPSEQSP